VQQSPYKTQLSGLINGTTFHMVLKKNQHN